VPDYVEAYASTTLTVGAWSHLALTYDGATLRLYVNGALAASTSRTGTIMTSDNPVQIGGDTVYGMWFSGLIDEVRIYNKALTQTQIQTDMNTPISGGSLAMSQSVQSMAIAAPTTLQMSAASTTMGAATSARTVSPTPSPTTIATAHAADAKAKATQSSTKTATRSSTAATALTERTASRSKTPAPAKNTPAKTTSSKSANTKAPSAKTVEAVFSKLDWLEPTTAKAKKKSK
jgi:hypothetical protein